MAKHNREDIEKAEQLGKAMAVSATAIGVGSVFFRRAKKKKPPKEKNRKCFDSSMKCGSFDDAVSRIIGGNINERK
jgi:hypothetical protein